MTPVFRVGDVIGHPHACGQLRVISDVRPSGYSWFVHGQDPDRAARYSTELSGSLDGWSTEEADDQLYRSPRYRRPLLRDHPFPEPAPTHTELRNRVRTIVGMPAPEHLPAEAADTEVVDDPDARRR